MAANAVEPADAPTPVDAVLTPNPAATGPAFKGWGTSLAWMANATGQYPQATRDALIDKVFGADGLNLNIARYNIGGGNATDIPNYLRPGGAVQGWWNPNAGLSDAAGPITSNFADRDRYLAAWTGANASDYNFDADPSQRAWVSAIKDKVTDWEAFSNSPPYFMTQSGYVSGGTDSNADQIKPEAVGKFATYLKTVAQHVEQANGIHFDSIDPLNEPNTNYWGTTIGGNGLPTGGGQEGAHAGPALQSQVLTALSAELAKPGTSTTAKVSGPDETSPGGFVQDWQGWTPAAQQAVSQLNVHTYSTGNRIQARDISKAAGKPLWMSEVEGNWGGNSWNPDSIENGLGIAGQITDDLRELDPQAWVLWQPVEDLYNMQLGEKKNWGSVFIDFDCNADGNSARRIADGEADPSCRTEVNSKYNTIRNFTHYIVPGDRIIPTSDTKTTSALKKDGSGLTMVHTNDSGQANTVKIDLSRFATITAGATVTPVVTTESPAVDPTANALVTGTPVTIDPATHSAIVSVPAKSVTTFVIKGASGVAADAPSLQDGKSYSIVGVQSGKALTASTGSPATVLGDSAFVPTQVWTATKVVTGDGTARDRFVLRLADGRALTADANGTMLRTLTDADARTDTSAQWMVSTTDGSSFSLLNAGRQQVLDVANQATGDGAAVGLWSSNGGANQAFTLVPAPDAGTGYTSFKPGQEWRDDAGNIIQAHGGQVVTSKDDSGRTIYYLYGEDRTNGYHSSPGVHAYSSYDLYNWKDQGVALRAMTSADQFTTDPYFQDLYAGYSAGQKDAVYRDLGTVQSDPNVNPPIIERPKVIYNAATNKWVMWMHADGPSASSNAQYAKANAGVAIADSPFGPFRYIDSSRLDYANPSDSSNHAPNNPGMARDMNLFVDTDGTGYIIYSSEENQTMFISKLNADYTDLSASPDKAVEGVDYRRVFVGESREAPALFSYQGRYFLITSGTSGWSPNPSKYGTAASILGDWSEVGDPFASDTSGNSDNSQPTSIIPVDAKAGKFIYMGDRWNGGTDLANAQMVWLPIQMGEGGKTLNIPTPSEWRLEDLNQYSGWTVSGVPTSLAVGQAFNPASVTVTQSGQSTVQAVQWKVVGATDTPGIITATGTLPGFGGRTFTRTIPVVPNGVQYAVNAGGQRTADWTQLMGAAAASGHVLNSTPDQAYGVDPGTQVSWGYDSAGSGTSGTVDGDMFSTLRYAVSGRDLTYRFTGLAPGTYTVYAGYYDPWAQWNNRGAKVSINGAVVEADHQFSGDYQTGAYKNVTVAADGKIAFALSPTRGPDVQLSWLMIANPVPVAPALKVAVAAGTKCIAGKALVTVQATNNETGPVQVKFTSAFGTKSFDAVGAGKNAVEAYTTRATTLPSGSVAVEAAGTVNGKPVTVSINAPYNATTCN